MVAQKKGRGAKTQAAKAKAAAAVVEEPQQEVEQEPMEAAEDNNGDSEQQDQSEGAVGGEEAAGEDQGQEGADGDAKPEDKKEEKVETGKLLVENLPSSYLFDYQEKLKELFSKHGEVLGVKWVYLLYYFLQIVWNMYLLTFKYQSVKLSCKFIVFVSKYLFLYFVRACVLRVANCTHQQHCTGAEY